ncbi:hypothetical protein NLJ89_g7202 [Agrocybe chaxingu]|uniref:Uncharacterized protein n=1 Tax=Agrocybe chaxingu TaxID=84603 RepID=A0A9W8MV99_9AGAR|nr:hypothetical protein NLJ89_g7202 [Agrocybe chaxingu]
MTDASPPVFQVVNTINLESIKDSKIISVSVYSGRAEITRLFKFNVKTLKEADEAIAEERNLLAGPTGNEKLNLKATIGVFAEFDGEIKIALIYGALIPSVLHLLPPH